jgi:hypothetical protein
VTSPQSFPTRQYSYRPAGVLEALDLPSAFTAQPGTVYRFHMGRDPMPVSMSVDDVRATLHDPFAQLVLGRVRSPQTARQLLASITDGETDADKLQRQRVFVVADGGQIPWSPETATLKREFRFLVVCSSAAGDPVLYASTTSPFDSKDAFLQVVGWDSTAGAYQFYDRRGGAWIWAGSSWEALDPNCRGKGPFDSHVNGSLNMKELSVPWLHWHSMSAAIGDHVLAPTDPLRKDPLWVARESAHFLEQEVIRPGIERWQKARFAACVGGNQLTRLPEFMRQVLGTSTVNIASSPDVSTTITPAKRVRLPRGFFLDGALVDELELSPGIARLPSVSGAAYLHCLEKYEVRVRDDDFRFPGDTYFAFPVPEASFEDTLVLRSLLTAGILSKKLAASLLMVDFTNPVFSKARTSLLRYVPEAATIGAASDFPVRFVNGVEQGAGGLPSTSGERQFLANWQQPDDAWRESFEKRLADYFTALAPMMDDPQRFEPLFELAESRRREFRKRPLHEFKLTTPVSNIPAVAPFLELHEDGRVTPK